MNNQKDNKNNVQYGGNHRVVPLYKEPKNSPFIPNEQKQLFAETHYPQTNFNPNFNTNVNPNVNPNYNPNFNQNIGDGNVNVNDRGPKPLVNLQVYPNPPPPKPKQPMPTIGCPMQTTTPYFPPQLCQLPPQMLMAPSMYKFLEPKVYNINIDGIARGHDKLNMIYEDMFPTKTFTGSMATLGERINHLNYCRSMLFSDGDGKNVALDGQSKNSLLAHLKIIDLNPYNTYKFSKNPYKGLPRNFLIYRSCYPIRNEARENATICAKNSIGANIRIYKMSEASYKLNGHDSDIEEFEEWRDVSFYEYIREHIVRKKICPNFIILYGYYIAENSGIDFDKILDLIGEPVIEEPKFLTNIPLDDDIKFKKPIILKGGAINNHDGTNELVESLVGYNKNDVIYGNKNKNQNKNQKGGVQNIVLNPNAYLGRAMVAMTEAPTYNLFGWTSKTYQREGNINRQINTGFHLDKVWYSVLFQIFTALYTMQIHNICFEDFSVEDNVYIKDINVYGAATKFWKYRIDGIDYYVPNYGYVALIDTNFKDIKGTDMSIIPSNCEPNCVHKLRAPFFDDKISQNYIRDKAFNAFKNAVDTNIYSNDFINNGGCKPPTEVIRFLDQISLSINSDENKNIGPYLYKYMRRFVNNRTGTYLKETEILNIRRDQQKDFIRGEIVVYEDGSSTYKFVIFIKLSKIGIANVLTKNDPTNDDIIDTELPITSLYGYNKMEPITQNFKPNEALLIEDELLETYVINS